MEFLILISGLAMLIFGAEGIIRGSVSLAKELQISLFAIGAVIVSAGTSLPELANCIRAVVTKHPDIAVGAIVGSNIANIFLVMGILAMINAVKVEQWVLDITLPLLVLITIATLGLIRVPFGRLSGSILFGFFILFIYELTIL